MLWGLGGIVSVHGQNAILFNLAVSCFVLYHSYRVNEGRENSKVSSCHGRNPKKGALIGHTFSVPILLHLTAILKPS